MEERLLQGGKEENRQDMEPKNISKVLTTSVVSFIQEQLMNKEKRIQHKEQCAERLAAKDGNLDEVRYSDQAVLANLDWGMEALEEAIGTSNKETKLARLDYAEKMLQVCAMLDSTHTTAGVPNFYLSAWAHLNLAYLWKLRNNLHNSVTHVLEMFVIDPFFSRVDFAPELWKDLFLPQMDSIVGWYSEVRHKLMMEVIPDSSDMSFTADLDQFFNESFMYSMSPEQVQTLQKVEQVYGESLDENTRMFARYFMECMSCDDWSRNRKMPIAEPPMNPASEVSPSTSSIRDFVSFGPILPKTAGFPKDKNEAAQQSTRASFSSFLRNESSKMLGVRQAIPEEEEEAEEEEEEEDVERNTLMSVRRTKKDKGSKASPGRTYSSSSCSSSPSPEVHQSPALRLLRTRIRESSISNSSLPASPSINSNSSFNSPRSDADGRDGRMRNMSYETLNNPCFENSSMNEADDGNQSCISIPMSDSLSSTRSRPPKDFVCPITGMLFNDPVTLETGQTYERKAIQEWVHTGNGTCPITRQPLSANSLPKTNYVLKRLITSWKQQHPDLAHEFSYSETPKGPFSPARTLTTSNSSVTKDSSDQNRPHQQRATRFGPNSALGVSNSPTSVLSQAAIDSIINKMQPYISCLCTSDNLQECESGVMAIAKLWKDAEGDPTVQVYLSKPTVVNGFVEVLSASLNREVLKVSIFLLSELMYVDESVARTLTNVDSDFDCLAALLKNGLSEAAVLIYQLQPSFAQLSSHDFIPSIIQLITRKGKESDDVELVIDPKDAAIAMLEVLLSEGDDNSRVSNAMSVISSNGIPALVKCLERLEARDSVVSILVCCMNADKGCRNLIAKRIQLSPVLEMFHSGVDSVKSKCIDFLSELVRLKRRNSCNQILRTIRDEGAFSTMHTFLVYLQMAPMEQQPAIATLLLQLDLLVEPRKMSIYREEAVETLIEALERKDFSSSQMMALDEIVCLSGRLTSMGTSYMESWLLKMAGFDKPYNNLMKAERTNKFDNDYAETMEEEEKAASCWEKRVAFVLCNHEKGAIFKALAECFRSNSIEMAKSCLVTSTWLTHMLSVLPDTGVRDVASKALLDEFVNILQSGNIEEKVMATLSLKSFITDPAALQELGKYARCIYKTLRKLKKYSPMISDVLKSLINSSFVDASELWNWSEVAELESCQNGEVLSLVHLKGRLISSHSDGTIKLWDAGKRVPRVIQELREHTKAVSCLYLSPGDNKLYSGSLDKTIRVWVIKPEEIHCVQVHDVREAVYDLTANSKVACFITQTTGVKAIVGRGQVYNWSGSPRHVNFNKNVRCLAMSGDKLYCGCSCYSIQEVDLLKLSSSPFYYGTRKLLGKQSLNSMRIQDGLLFAAGSALDGTAGKVFALSSKTVSGSLTTSFDVKHIAVNNDFIITVTKWGVVEVWLKERVSKVACIRMSGSGSAKVSCLTTDADGGMLYAGSSDGKIQVWALD
ncbi:Putative E3 ubiquitin-protein ligase LIN-1 [Linum grandiflorum]